METLKKPRGPETRWANSFLSPEEPRWDYRGRGTKGAEFRWELHTSQTDVDIARSTRSKCSCQSLTLEEGKRSADRGDLRKHHSAEIDKWTLHPDAAAPRHHLRKHNSDDTRMARDAKWTLQVPEVLPNPKNRCTCSRAKRLSLSPADAQPSIDHSAKWVYRPQPTTPEKSAPSSSKSASKKHSEVKDPKSPDVRVKPAGRELKRQTRIDSQNSTKRWELKDHTLTSDEVRKITQSRWSGKTHLSLPIETQFGTSWIRGQRSLGETSAPKGGEKHHERHKLATCKSLSPEPVMMDRAMMIRSDNGGESSTAQHLFPEIAITDAKWAPYEGCSPLPNVGTKKRDQKLVLGTSETKWTPRGEEPTVSQQLIPGDNSTDDWSPFRHVTPTFFPPPQSSPEVDDDGRWKFLNQISPFPIYQGAWKEYTPPEEVEKPGIATPEKSSTLPLVPVPSPKIVEVEVVQSEAIRRVKSEEAPVQTLESRNRQRPQLLRSKALLEVPTIDPAKRSLSEEVPRYRMNETVRGPYRARSEEGPNYGDPWYANNLVVESAEMCQYVTTV